jgi:hypothetical protein
MKRGRKTGDITRPFRPEVIRNIEKKFVHNQSSSPLRCFLATLILSPGKRSDIKKYGKENSEDHSFSPET